MCLLMMKPSGVKYDHDFIVSAINNGIIGNRDGLGGAIRKSSSNKLKLKKGFLNNTKKEFFQWLLDSNIQPEDELMVHLRWGTAGQKSVFNQHPYILGEKSRTNPIHNFSELTLESDDVKTGVFAHNGVFSMRDYTEQDSKLSDTYNWGITHFRSEGLINLLKNYPTSILSNRKIKDSLIGEKVCFMFPDAKMIVEGAFIKDQGYLFSNGGYRDYNNLDRGGKKVKNNYGYSELLGDEDDEMPNFDSCGVGFNLFMDVEDDDTKYKRWLAEKSHSNVEDVEIIEESVKEDTTKNTPVTKIIEVISKDEDTRLKKIVQSSFSYDFSLEETTTPPVKERDSVSKRMSYFNKKYKLGKLDKIIKISKKPKAAPSSDDYFTKFAVPADFSLPITLTLTNKNRFTVSCINDEFADGNKFLPGTIFTIANVDIDFVTLRGQILTDDKIDEFDDYVVYLRRTHNEIGNNFKIQPRMSAINIYRDYMRLVQEYGAEISKNKSKILRNLQSSIAIAIKNNIAKQDNPGEREWTFIRAKYCGEALIEFYDNFVKYKLELEDEKKTRIKSILSDPTFSNADNHVSNIMA